MSWTLWLTPCQRSQKNQKVGPTRTYQNLQFTTFLAHHFIILPKKINMGDPSSRWAAEAKKKSKLFTLHLHLWSKSTENATSTAPSSKRKWSPSLQFQIQTTRTTSPSPPASPRSSSSSYYNLLTPTRSLQSNHKEKEPVQYKACTIVVSSGTQNHWRFLEVFWPWSACDLVGNFELRWRETNLHGAHKKKPIGLLANYQSPFPLWSYPPKKQV